LCVALCEFAPPVVDAHLHTRTWPPVVIAAVVISSWRLPTARHCHSTGRGAYRRSSRGSGAPAASRSARRRRPSRGTAPRGAPPRSGVLPRGRGGVEQLQFRFHARVARPRGVLLLLAGVFGRARPPVVTTLLTTCRST
jgi:hypothetical protein